MSYHMGINLGHERSVAIVKDGEILVAIEQERLDRRKYSLGYTLQAPGDPSQIQIPGEAIRYCLDTCNIRINDLATITANMPGHDFAPDILHRVLPAEVASKVLQLPNHHLAHACSAYYPSGFEDAVILVVDAAGSATKENRTESYTLYEGRGQNLLTLHSETVASHLAGLSTLGFLYEYITRKAGFISQVGDKIKHAEAGKLMGLAPFGKHQPNLHSWIQTQENSYSLKISAYDIFLEVAALEKRYDTGEGKPYLRPYLVDLAYKVQHELEQALIHIVGVAVKQTGLRKLCIAGGVGLNSVANYKLLDQLHLNDIFIFPAAGDSGIATGCALWAYYTAGGGEKRVSLSKATLGRCYSFLEVKQALHSFQDVVVVEELTKEEIIVRSAQALAKGNIVARFEGGSEYGPRALGHRSIMADPTFKCMKDILNARVKFREAFRPFAPVIPLESISQVFEQQIAAPFMLVVPQIKPEFYEIIPAVTHVDGTGRVQTVTEPDNFYFYRLCHQLVQERQGPPVLLNTSFNVAGQPIVETPLEAIETFLSTDIDYLAIENFWVAKRHVPVLNYEQHLDLVGSSTVPQGLPFDVPNVTKLMAILDRALFFGATANCPWSVAQLKVLSSQGAQYKETSVLFPETPFVGRLDTQLSNNVILLLDPYNKSALVDLTQKVLPTAYSFAEVKLLLAVLNAPRPQLEQMRMELHLTTLEFEQRLAWARVQLDKYELVPQFNYTTLLPPDSPLTEVSQQTFAPFADENFSARSILGSLRQCLHQAGYQGDKICQLLGVTSQQNIEPTYLHYYGYYRLPQTHLGDLIRLFMLRGGLSQIKLREIFGNDLFWGLCSLGILIPRGEAWASRVDLFEVVGLYLATDHRYMMLPEDDIDESPVMYIGMDSMGLVHTAPQYSAMRVLDLCCGSGVQGLVASRYAQEVIGVDINPRAIRFSRFNAQLNGIDNIQFRLGNLYAVVEGYFNTILANPPFVPSPKGELRFRDGGATGEEILAQIITDSADYLATDGRLFIVTDLVNVQQYASKLSGWWRKGAADKLVLCTADRNDILFSVPHCHAAFNQSFEQYNAELDQWLDNFHTAELTTVNFGYILIACSEETKSGSYYIRTIHNPTSSIYPDVQAYFESRHLLSTQNCADYFLALAPDLHFRTEINPQTGSNQIEIFSPHNSYFTTYPISEQMYALLLDINHFQPKFATYTNPVNLDCLQDLIYKGILALISERLPNVLPHPANQYKNNINIQARIPSLSANSSVKTVIGLNMQTDAGLFEELSIVELQTKTTPTCLSSYLR